MVGLGVGSLAAYGHRGQELTFFEIDPAVEQIARDDHYFTFLRDCPAKVNVVLGDARLALAREADSRFALIVIDAFSGDAVPVHLLTREALSMYRGKLAPGGVIAFHISNSYLRLGPVIGNLADAAGLVGLEQNDAYLSPESGTSTVGKTPSHWIVVAEDRESFGELNRDSRWRPLVPDKKVSLWTDDFSNLLEVFEWPKISGLTSLRTATEFRRASGFVRRHAVRRRRAVVLRPADDRETRTAEVWRRTAVWNTCMVFFQAALLAGYIYAHTTTQWLGVRRQAILHLGLLAMPWLVLPIAISGDFEATGDAEPILPLLVLLVVTAGLPFFVVSTSAPLLQTWFAASGHRARARPLFPLRSQQRREHAWPPELPSGDRAALFAGPARQAVVGGIRTVGRADRGLRLDDVAREPTGRCLWRRVPTASRGSPQG